MSEKKHLSSFHSKVKKRFERRFGSALAPCDARQQAPQRLNRRHFLKVTGLTALGSAFMLGQLPMAFALAPTSVSGAAGSNCGDQILLLLRLKGGNDGLNMVILRGNDDYSGFRPGMSLPETSLPALDEALEMPNALLDLRPSWQQGNLQIIRDAGYPDANYFDFRCGDIWANASGEDEVPETGWMGRWFVAGAPMILLGKGVGNLSKDQVHVDPFGDPMFYNDFRQVYACVLQNQMDVHGDETDFVLGKQHFVRIPGLLPAGNPPPGSNNPAVLLGHNPSAVSGTIQIKYALKIKGNVRLQILDKAGHPLRTLVNEFKERGSYTLEFNPATFFLPAGEYVYRLDTSGKVLTRPIKW